jgi:hypothetical protein
MPNSTESRRADDEQLHEGVERISARLQSRAAAARDFVAQMGYLEAVDLARDRFGPGATLSYGPASRFPHGCQWTPYLKPKPPRA